MLKINGFAFLNAADQKIISYTHSVYNDDGVLLKNNIRKSTPINAEQDAEVLAAIATIEAFLINKEMI